jgi:hypothetical protein
MVFQGNHFAEKSNTRFVVWGIHLDTNPIQQGRFPQESVIEEILYFRVEIIGNEYTYY